MSSPLYFMARVIALLYFCASMHALAAPITMPVDMSGLKPDTVLVSTDRVTVTYRDFLAEIARIPEKDRLEFLISRQRLATLVDNLMINKTLAKEARESGIDKLEHVQAEIQNQTDKVLARYRGQAIINDLPKVDLTAVAKEAYLVDEKRYQSPKQFETWHVLIDTKGRTKEQAQKLANDLRAKVLAGEALDQIATTYSNDPSATKNKGRLPPLPQDAFAASYGNTIAKMKIGEVSHVVETQFGFHVIKLLSLIPESRVPFETAKSELIAEAQLKREDTSYQAYIDSLKRDKSFKLNMDALDAIRPALPAIPSPDATPPKQ